MMMHEMYQVKVVEKKRRADGIGAPSNESRLNKALMEVNDEAVAKGCSLSVSIVDGGDEYVILYAMPAMSGR